MARAFVAASEQYLVDLSLALTEPYSFGGWVYPVSTTDHKTIIAIVDASKDTHFHQLRVSNNDDIGFRVRQSNDVLVTTSDVTLNTWNHALGVARGREGARGLILGTGILLKILCGRGGESPDLLGYSADSRGHHRRTAGQRLDHHIGKGVGFRGMEKQVGRLVVKGHLLGVRQVRLRLNPCFS